MKKILLAVIVLVACCTVERKPATMIPYGDWVFVNRPGEMTRYSGLQFKGVDFYFVSDSGKTWTGKYLLSGDTLMVKDGNGRLRYTIQMHGSDTLSLIGGGWNMLYRRAADDNDKLRLNEVRLVAGSCFFACPLFELTVAVGTRAKYVGGENTKFKGEKLLSISPEEWNALDTLFRWSKIVSCDTVFASLADDRSLSVEVTYNGDRHKKIRTSEFELLPRMKPFVEKLIQIVKKEDLI